MKNKIGKVLRTARDLILTPHLAICFFIAWIITNGWAYVALGVGTYYEYKWLAAIAATYLAILWSPLCAEGILTFLIAIFFFIIWLLLIAVPLHQWGYQLEQTACYSDGQLGVS